MADPEGIGGSGGISGSGGSNGGGVPEEKSAAEALADEEIKIAIAIGIRKGRF